MKWESAGEVVEEESGRVGDEAAIGVSGGWISALAVKEVVRSDEDLGGV